MSKETFENSFEKGNKKYSMDDSADHNEMMRLERMPNNKKNREVQEICRNDYMEPFDRLKKYANKEDFNKMVITPFYRVFHTYADENSNTIFVPAIYFPRLENLQKLMPGLSENGLKMVMKHEKHHNLCKAGDAAKSNVGKIEEESLANQQSIKEIINKEHANLNAEEIIGKIVEKFILINVLAHGRKCLLSSSMENDAIEWFRKLYFFNDNDDMLERNCDDENGFLKEYIELKKQNKSNSYYKIFIDEFHKYRDELFEKYKEYISNNNIDNLTDIEDREADELREKIIECLNQKKII